MLILDLWGISFHAVVVFGLGKNLLFKSILGHCDIFMYIFSRFKQAKILQNNRALIRENKSVEFIEPKF